MRMTLLICAIGLVSSDVVGAQAPAGNARIVGRVIDADTNEPIAGARVSAVQVYRLPPDAPFRPPPPVRPEAQVNTMTDADGRFVLDGVSLRELEVLARKPGFAQNSMAATTRAGESTVVNIALRRGGVLSGRVLDERGQPLSNIRMMAQGRGVVGIGPVLTNDLGEFRIVDLAAGGYVLYGAAPPQPPSRGDGTGATTFDGPTYYPGTLTEAEAQIVTVPPGETVTGLEFRLIVVPAFRVSGIALDEAGKPVANAVVLLNPVPTDRDQFPLPTGMGFPNATGAFTIDGVLAGHYIVSARRMPRPESGVAPIITPLTWAERMGPEVHVDGADVTGVKVIVATPR